MIGGHYDLSALSLPGAGNQVVDMDSPKAYDKLGGYRATIVIGRLLISVVYLYGYENREISYSRLLPVMRIWPPASAGVLWPSVPAAFTPQSVDAFKEENLVLTPFHP